MSEVREHVDEQGVDEEPIAGWFEAVEVEPPPVFGGLCRVCQHPVSRLGLDWVCTEKCRCLMLGCVRGAEGRL